VDGVSRDAGEYLGSGTFLRARREPRPGSGALRVDEEAFDLAQRLRVVA